MSQKKDALFIVAKQGIHVKLKQWKEEDKL